MSTADAEEKNGSDGGLVNYIGHYVRFSCHVWSATARYNGSCRLHGTVKDDCIQNS